MGFDLSTARLVESTPGAPTQGFDPAGARPIGGGLAMPGQIPVPAPGEGPQAPPAVRAQGLQREASVSERIIGAVETGVALLTQLTGGTVGMVGGTLGGLAGSIRTGQFGTPEGARMVEEVASEAAQGLSYQPRTPVGAEMTESVGDMLGQLPAVAGVYGTVQGPAMGLPQAAGAAAAAAAPVVRRGLEMPGQAAQAVRQVTQRARGVGPTPGTQGSAGAAGTDMATQRRERARGLPVPFEGEAALTEGQATRSFEQQRFERETAKDPDTGKPLRERATAQNQVALRNLDAIEAFTGAQKTDRGAAGQVVVDAIAEKAQRAKKEIDDAYGAARDAGDMADPVDATPLAMWVEDNRSSAGNAGVISTAEAELMRLGGAQKAGDGSLVPREITVNDLEELRKKVVAGGKKDATNAHFAAQINKVIDDITDGKGGDLYKEARGRFRAYQKEFKERGAIRDLIGIKKGTSDRITATEKVLERAMRSADDLKNVRETLVTAGDGGVQAWREVQGQAVRKLRDEVTKNVALDEKGNPILSPAKLKATIDSWDNDGRLEVLFGKKGAETMRDLRDTAQDLFTAPPGAVNTSNTASVMAKWFADSAASFVATGVPVPLVSLTRAAWKARSDRKVKKQVEKALGPKEAATTAADAEVRNPLAGSDALPPAAAGAAARAPRETPVPTGRAAELTPQQAEALLPTRRETELLRLREEVTDPEVRRELDADIAAERKKAGAAARAAEYRRLAERASEPELRAELQSRAAQLAPEERIPAGEAVELDVQTVEPRPVLRPEKVVLPAAEMADWRKTHKFGDLDAKTADDVATALGYDAAAVERAVVQLDKSPRAFEREIARIIEEGKARESQTESPAGGSQGPDGPARGARGEGGEGAGGADAGEGGLGVRPRGPGGKGDSGGSARPNADEVAPAASADRRADFADWIKGTKVVDAKGEPLTLYHGTADAFDQFDASKVGANFRGDYGTGFYFTQNPKAAARYAASAEGAGSAGANIRPVYLALRNPKIVKAAFGDGDLWKSVPGAKTSDDLTAGLKAQGFDGVIVDGGRAGSLFVKEAVAFSADQVRSAIADRPPLSPAARHQAEARAGFTKATEPTGNPLTDRLSAKLRGDYEGARREYDALKDSRGGVVLNTDTARELSPDYLKDRTRSNDVHEPASAFIKRVYADKLAAPTPPGKQRAVLFTAGGTGAGKTTGQQAMGDALGQPEIVFDTNMNTMEAAVQKIEQALGAGRDVSVLYTYADPVQAFEQALGRTINQKKKFGSGRTVPIRDHIDTHVGASRVIRDLADKYRHDLRVELLLVDNSRGKGKAAQVENIADLPLVRDNGLREQLEAIAREAHRSGRIDDATLAGYLGEPSPAVRVEDLGKRVPAPVQREGARDKGSESRLKASPPAPEPAPQRPAMPGPVGASTSVVTERGLRVPVQYRLVDVDSLITSHGDDLKVNPAFDQTMQPRDRARASSEAQITRMQNALQPELLAESPKASDGAPIVSPDGTVLSGNARTIAVRRAYRGGQAEAYRQWLADNAERFGLTREQVLGMRRPVLAREHTVDIDRAEFARQANESPVAAMSETEQAFADAKNLPDLEKLDTNEDGTINLQRSADFVRQFMLTVASPAERGQLMTADGRPSQRLASRIRNAVFAHAYGDADMVARMAEATDGNTRNVLAGLLRAAPDVARLRELSDAGARPPAAFVPDVLEAARRFVALREEGMTVRQGLAQGSLVGGEASPRVAELMAEIEVNARAPRRVADMVRRLVELVDGQGDPRQVGMF